MSEETGDEGEDEGELAPPGWRASKPTDAEREEEHEATQVPYRDWRTHCMMGKRRTHHHVTKQKNEDQSGRPAIAMDYYLGGPLLFLGAHSEHICAT